MLYSQQPDSQHPLLLIGTYTEWDDSKSEGIYVYHMDASSGELFYESVIKDVPNASYMTVHPQLRLIFAVSETDQFDGKPGGGVSVLARDSSGNFQVIHRQSSGGAKPAYISIDQQGRFALVANSKAGNVAVLPIEADGRLGPPSDVVQHFGLRAQPERQEYPHPHCIIPDPTNRFVLVADLGADKIFIYHLDLDEGKLHNHTEVEVEARSGPRHILFDSTGQHLYVMNKLTSNIILFDYDPTTGTLERRHTISTLPEDFSEINFCGDCHLSTHERFLYASNRGHDSIVCFKVDSNSGELTYQSHIPSHGHAPRIFALDPSGQFIVAANQKSHNAVVYKRDLDSGNLFQTGYEAQLDMPAHVLFI